MKLHQQYLLLHSQLGEASEHTITLADLAVILDCTHRNTLTIVKKMASLGWIHWHAQRGYRSVKHAYRADTFHVETGRNGAF